MWCEVDGRERFLYFGNPNDDETLLVAGMK